MILSRLRIKLTIVYVLLAENSDRSLFEKEISFNNFILIIEGIKCTLTAECVMTKLVFKHDACSDCPNIACSQQKTRNRKIPSSLGPPFLLQTVSHVWLLLPSTTVLQYQGQ